MLQLANFRRGVIAPLDNHSACIGCGAFYSPVRVDHIAIGDDLFDALWASRIFKEINNACGTLIDDYEEAEMKHDCFPLVLKVLSKYRKEITDERVLDFIKMLESLMQNAMQNKTGVWFVL